MKISRLMAKFITWTTIHQITENVLSRHQDFSGKVFLFCKSEYDIEEWFFLSLLPKNTLIYRLNPRDLNSTTAIDEADLENPNKIKVIILDSTSLASDCQKLAIHLNRLTATSTELIPLLLCNRYVEILGGNYTLESGPSMFINNHNQLPLTGQILHIFLRKNLDRYLPQDHDWFPRLLSNMAANQGAPFFQTLQLVNGSLSSQVLAEWLELKSQLSSLPVERLPNKLPGPIDLLLAPVWLLLSFSAALVWWPVQEFLLMLPRHLRVISIPVAAITMIVVLTCLLQMVLPSTVIFWPLLAVTGCKHRAWIKQKLTNQRGWLLSKREKRQFQVLQEKILYLVPAKSKVRKGSYRELEEASIL
ncbi:hypothetical protein [Gynuella sp.]|uniref:hypothetical protein n=1 Tax=Gynuella sp. TaxID=2969146 RepID=UPI003D12B3EE